MAYFIKPIREKGVIMLFVIMLIIVSMSLALLYNRVFKTIYYPGIIFNFVWTIILSLSVLNLYNFYEVKTSTLYLLLFGLILFNFPCAIHSLLSLKNKHSNSISGFDRVNISENFNPKIIFYISLITLLAMIPFVYKALMIVNAHNNGWAVMREVYTKNLDYFFPAYLRMIYIDLLIFPLINITYIINVILFIQGKCKFTQLAVSIISKIFIIVVTSGRMSSVTIVLFLVFAYLLYPSQFSKVEMKNINKTKKIKRLIVITISFVFLYGIYNTLSRGGSSISIENFKDFGFSLIHYFTGSIVYFDKILENYSLYGIAHPYGFGISFFSGLFTIFTMFFNLFPGIHVGYPSVFAHQYMEGFVPIGPGVMYNAFPTMYYYFMRDGNIIGFMVLTILFGIITITIYSKFQKNKTIINAIYLLLVLYVVIYSPLWWESYRISFWAQLLHLIWIMPLAGYKVKKYVFKGNES